MGRSLFNRPAWSAAAATSKDGDIFSRGSTNYVSRMSDRAVRKEDRKALRKSTEQSEDEEASEGHRQKRRRTERLEDGYESSASDEPTKSRAQDSGHVNRERHGIPKEPSKSATPARLPSMTPKSPTPASTPKEEPVAHPSPPRIREQSASEQAMVVLDEEPSTGNKSSRPNDFNDLYDVSDQASEAPETPEESDDEFFELSRRAREQVRQRHSDSQPFPSQASDPPESPKRRTVEPPNRASTPPSDAPVVRIRVITCIPHTRSLDVRRRLDQRLRDVRTSWCQYVNLADEEAANVILVWRDMRLFDSSSCESLGLGVDEDGDITRHGRKEATKAARQCVSLEAMTLPMLEERKKEKARQRDRGNEDKDGSEVEEIEAAPQQQEAERRKARLVIKAKDYPELRVETKWTTQVWRIARGFKLENRLPEDREVRLVFDGEPLDPEARIEDTEVGDMDTIEAYLK